MAATPTLTLSGGTGFVVIDISTSSATDRIEAWRINPDGSVVRIAYTITTTLSHGVYIGSFVDYNVASGQNYRYFLRGVDVSLGTADSATKAIDVVLSNGQIHAVTKTDRAKNRIVPFGGVGEYDLIPQTQGYGRDSQSYMLGNSVAPTQKQSGIEQGTTGVTFRVVGFTVLARQVFTSRGICCFRNAVGWLAFGRISSYQEAYFPTYTDVSLQVQILDYDENVNS